MPESSKRMQMSEMVAGRPLMIEDHGFSTIHNPEKSDAIVESVLLRTFNPILQELLSWLDDIYCLRPWSTGPPSRNIQHFSHHPKSLEPAPRFRNLFQPHRRTPSHSPEPSTETLPQINRIFWPSDLLAKDERFAKSRILTWGYNSNVTEIWKSVSHENISGLGQNFMVALQQIRKSNPNRLLIFVAHSLGGLLVKIALSRSRASKNRPQFLPIYRSTIGIIFLGTPQRGSGAADWGLLVSNISKFALRSRNTKILKGLVPNNELLENISEDFINLLGDDEPKVYFHSFYETKCTSGIAGISGEVVPKKYAVIGHLRETAMGIDGSHSEVCKFGNASDAGYKAVIGALEDYVDVAKEQRRIEVEAKQEEFCIAVEDGNEEVVKSLLEWGVEPDREEQHFVENHREGRKRPLWIAAQAGHAGVLKLLLESDKGVDIDARSNNNLETALAETAIYGKEAAARVLLDHGANANGLAEGWRPICLAAQFFGGPGLIRLLIERGAKVDVRSGGQEGSTPLHLASCPQGDINRAVILVLLKAGADIDALDEAGQTPEESALNGGRTEAVTILQEWRRNRAGDRQDVAV